MPDGTEIRVEGLTWGTNKFLEAPPFLLRRVVSRVPDAWLPSRFRSPAYRADTISGRQVWGDGVYVWLRRYDPKMNIYLDCAKGELLTFDSAGVVTKSTGGSGFDLTLATEAAGFDLMDWRQDTLRFQLRVGGSRHDFVLPNPRRDETFPEWPALPLPQSVERGPYTLTLSQLNRVKGSNVRWSAQVTIARGGADVTPWFKQVRQFVDPTGNRHWERLPASEPVWGVEVTAHPSATFPFDESAAVKLGNVTVPAPGKFAAISPDTISTNDRLQWAVVLGSGSFAFHNGTNTSSSPYCIGRGSPLRRSGKWNFSFDSAFPALGILVRVPPTERNTVSNASVSRKHLVVRGLRADRTVIQGEVDETISFGNAGDETVLVTFDLRLAKPGERLDLDLFFVQPIHAKFTFAAPRTE